MILVNRTLAWPHGVTMSRQTPDWGRRWIAVSIWQYPTAKVCELQSESLTSNPSRWPANRWINVSMCPESQSAVRFQYTYLSKVLEVHDLLSPTFFIGKMHFRQALFNHFAEKWSRIPTSWICSSQRSIFCLNCYAVHSPSSTSWPRLPTHTTLA